jgi:hypothetical protein
MGGAADGGGRHRTLPPPWGRRLPRSLPGRRPRLGPAGSVRSEAGARAAVVAVSLALSLGLSGMLRLVLAVAG